MDQKVCKSCQNMLDSSFFWKRAGGKGGMFANCISCEKELIKHRIRVRTANGPTKIISEQRCGTCKETKPINDFYKDKNKATGHCSTCKNCSDQRAKKWSDNNWDRRMAVAKKRLEEAPYKAYYGSAFWRDTDSHENYLKTVRKAGSRYASTKRGRGVSRNLARSRLFKNKGCVPEWADQEAIIDFYGNCPPGYTVDHIVPINGRQVCGLHVLENLQYLTRPENARKHNRFSIQSSDLHEGQTQEHHRPALEAHHSSSPVRE